MTLIRIDPTEMESASNELQAQAAVVGETLTGLRAQTTLGSLPPALASQVNTTLATLERSLADVRTELLLEGTVLALRGILAIQGSANAGELGPPMVDVVATGPIGGFTGGGFSSYGAGIDAGSVGGFTGGGLTPYGSALDPVVQSGSNGLPDLGSALDRAPRGGWAQALAGGGLKPADITGIKSTTTAPKVNDFRTWANSMTQLSEDGMPRRLDPNPGTYDPAIHDDDPRTKPSNH